MSTISITITGLDTAIKNMGNIADKKLPLALKAGLTKSSLFVLSSLNKNTPVDTGRLKSSNRISELTDNSIKIGPDTRIAPYAKWVEHGHHTRSGSWVLGQHYIQRTTIETVDRVAKIFETAIRLALK